ncbi:CGNR zinc finger domain-containing protein [Amycolatopsis sp. FBCC-B4732]|uniref:CGNR zinc finger domain-containing protein n=1 Tax=Amycolatopsis sp. FBCC-B4732 TaxID=3079339 RepID=UPI001FF6DE9B|nr:CGNR zinc finger domain-containing protein [Amycolatopsis sp. FBCC-B4732]UOX85975.1 CGNR zinc finger domain-containing protein [Amycolatopsis sp. FBCC-B4732]
MVTAAPGEERSPALALVNTRRLSATGEVDDLAGPRGAAGWLRRHDLVAADLGPADVARLGELRGAVRELLAALAEDRVPDAAAVTAVNAAARADAAAPQLTWRDGPRREWRSTRPGTVDEAVAALARDAIDVVGGDLGRLVRPCEAHGCVRFFFREHARRRWCSTTCGDRVRAARHQRLVVEQREASAE